MQFSCSALSCQHPDKAKATNSWNADDHFCDSATLLVLDGVSGVETATPKTLKRFPMSPDTI